jgi:glycosyltransferase involved in cell wall biosynthesis
MGEFCSGKVASKRVLFLQNELPDYRRGFYNILAPHFGELCVLHSGRPGILPGDAFTERVVPKINVGSLRIQPRALAAIFWERYDVIVAGFDLHWPFNFLAPLNRHRPRYLLWGHRYSGNSLANWAKDRIMSIADGQVLYSREDFPALAIRGVDMSTIAVAENTVGVSNAENLSGSAKSSFLFVGRLQERKGVPELIEAFAELRRSVPRRISLDIVGDGPELARCRKAVEVAGIQSDVIFHGASSDEQQLRPLFLKAIAYVSPGPVGLGVLHAFAYGVPVVTRRNVRHGPEFTNLENGINALIYDDPRELAGTLRHLAQDPQLARTLGCEAFRHYDENRRVEQMAEAFRAAILG